MQNMISFYINYTDYINYHNKWILDDDVSQCTNCKITFGFFTRKHHCRLCGDIFCDSCSSYNRHIPSILTNKNISNEIINNTIINWMYDDIYDYKLSRLCITCNNYIIRFLKIKKIVKVYEIINLDILELQKIENTGLYKLAANICINKLLGITKKYIYEKISNTEKIMLWRNIKYYYQHSSYIKLLLRICSNENQFKTMYDLINDKTGKYNGHNILPCDNNCKTKMETCDVINLFSYLEKYNYDIFKKILIDHINCDDEEFLCYLPLITYYTKYDDSFIITEKIIERCKDKFNIFYTVYNLLNNYMLNGNEQYKHVKNKIYNTVCVDKILSQLLECDMFINTIKKIGTYFCDNNTNIKLSDLNICRELRYPLDPSLKIKSFCIDEIKFKESATKPIIIPCITSTNIKIYLMYKKDDLKQDLVMMSIIRLVNIIIKKDLDININLVTYNIIPFCKNTGIIEIIHNADTIYHIRHVLNNNILNYILEKNSGMEVGIIKDRYIKSVAGYSVLTYMFGIGDRHLDNIMISRDGRLFHIDYGFILGKDPIGFTNPEIRITTDMIDAMGGNNSNYHKKFEELSLDIYIKLRNNINILTTMIMFIKNITDAFTEPYILSQIEERFMPHKTDEQSKKHLIEKIGKQKIEYSIKDFCHLHSKEQTVKASIDSITNMSTTIINSFSNLTNIFKTNNTHYYKK